jgi:broad specificity phosphatase PhoE
LAAKYFKEVKIDVVYGSPLARAWETAKRIAQVHNLEAKALNGIIDISFGGWEGHPRQEVERNNKELYQQWKQEPHLVKLPGGESLEDVRIRSMTAMEEVIRLHPRKTLVLVSHRVVNKVIICGDLGLDNSHFGQIPQGDTAINLIQYRKGKYILSLMNEACHLNPLREERVKRM